MANTEARRRPFTYQLAADGTGKHAAYRQEEPVFFVIRDSEAAAVAAADEICRDYVARFEQPPDNQHAVTQLTVYQFKKIREMEAA